MTPSRGGDNRIKLFWGDEFTINTGLTTLEGGEVGSGDERDDSFLNDDD